MHHPSDACCGRIPIEPAAPPLPTTAISCLGVSRTPAVGARGWRRHAGVRETCTLDACRRRAWMAASCRRPRNLHTSGLTHRSKTSAVARLFDHLVGAVKSVGGTSRPSAFATIRLTTRPNLAGCSEDRRASPPAKSCRLSRPGAAEVDEGHRADGGREFLFFVADVPNADYLARCVLDRVITGHVRFAEDVDFAVESLTFVDIHYR